ncbi:hypothetical protein DV966_14220, partial [Staphylococcus pseudintermedius]
HSRGIQSKRKIHHIYWQIKRWLDEAMHLGTLSQKRKSIKGYMIKLRKKVQQPVRCSPIFLK